MFAEDESLHDFLLVSQFAGATLLDLISFRRLSLDWYFSIEVDKVPGGIAKLQIQESAIDDTTLYKRILGIRCPLIDQQDPTCFSV